MATERQRTKSWRRAWLGAGFLVVACVNLVPRQGWDPAAGPVVPHDTFPADCSLCHVGSDWHTLRDDFAYDHAEETGVALTGAHADAGCLLCHNDRGPVQQFAQRGCGGCHADPHLTRLGANCQDCHDERTWYPREAIVLHDATRFPLVGAHAAVACFRCHPGAQVGNFAGASSICSDCHGPDYAATTNPDHAAVGFSMQCDECHRPTRWQPAAFAHPASFPLANAHAGRSCSECHTTANVFTGLSTDCNACHDDDWQATVEPGHAAAGFSMQCDECHDATTFRRANWPHPGSFAMTFGHAGRRCSECHTGQVYAGTQSDCASCHLDDHQATQNPNHTLAGFGTDCQTCHNTALWNGAMVEHPASFPLENAHQRACSACHQGGVYQGLDPSCIACHQQAYAGAQNPNHVAAGFPLDCGACHGTATWSGAAFTHPASFPLTNSHQVACNACHQGGVFQGLDPSCAACHLAEYQATTNPSHVGFQLSQQCESCHNTVAWGQVSFQHQFPIQGGDHGGLGCAQCHDNPANQTAFTCTNCHEHEQKEMDDKHDDVPGYVWLTSACYQCHPTGSK